MYNIYFNVNMFFHAEDIRVFLNGLLLMNQQLVGKLI